MRGLCLGFMFVASSIVLAGCGGDSNTPVDPAMQNVAPEDAGDASADMLKQMSPTPGDPAKK